MPPQEKDIFHTALFHFQTWPGYIFITLDSFFQPQPQTLHCNLKKKKKKYGPCPNPDILERPLR